MLLLAGLPLMGCSSDSADETTDMGVTISDDTGIVDSDFEADDGSDLRADIASEDLVEETLVEVGIDPIVDCDTACSEMGKECFVDSFVLESGGGRATYGDLFTVLDCDETPNATVLDLGTGESVALTKQECFCR